MSSTQDTKADELEIDIAEDESGNDSRTIENNEGEQEDSELNLEVQEEAPVDKLSPAEAHAKQQEEAWLSKVISGKSDVTDAPSWLHARLNTRLESTNNAPNTEDVVKKILEQEREENEFKNLQSEIPKLTPLQAKELQERFSSLKSAGKVVALRASLDAMGLSQKLKDAEAKGIAKGRMSIPRSGQPSVRKSDQSVGGVPLNVINDDKAWNKMIRTGKQN